MRFEIKKSQSYKTVRIVVVALFALLLLALTSALMSNLSNVLSIELPLLSAIFRITVIGVSIGAVIATWLQDKNKHYFIEGDKLVITNKSMLKGTTKKVVALDPKTIFRLDMSQNIWGKQMNYGTIAVGINTYSEKEVHSLQHVDNPKQVFETLQTYLRTAKK